MVSGLKSNTYEERLKELGLTTLEERRHQTDMLQPFKILTGKDKVKSESLLAMASDSERAKRTTTGPLNIRVPAPKLEIRRHFYSQRVGTRTMESGTACDKAGKNGGGIQKRLSRPPPRYGGDTRQGNGGGTG